MPKGYLLMIRYKERHSKVNVGIDIRRVKEYKFGDDLSMLIVACSATLGEITGGGA